MPQIQTKCFGITEYSRESVYHFPSGLPGFEAERAFVFLERADAVPLMFMQSLVTPDLCFILLPILAADAHYRLQLTAEDRIELQLPADHTPEIGEDILCAAILCAAGESRPHPTANLLSPVVVNLEQRIGIQAIQAGSGYSHQHPLFVEEEVAQC